MPCHQSFRVTDCVSDSQQPCAPALDLKKKINQHLESVVNWCILHPDRATLLNSPVKTHSLTVSCNFQAQLARLGHMEESSARQHLLQKGSWEKDKSNITTATLSSGSVTSWCYLDWKLSRLQKLCLEDAYISPSKPSIDNSGPFLGIRPSSLPF